MKAVTLLASLVLLLGITAATLSGQTTEAESPKKKAIKFDEIGEVDVCELRRRVSRFMVELSNKPDHEGYIINYSGIAGPPANVQIAGREREITNSIALRHFDRSRITLVRGGTRSEQTTELWLLPPDVDRPAPSGTLDSPDDPAENQGSATYLFILRDLEFYERDLDDFILASVKQREADERLEVTAANDDEPDEPELTADNSRSRDWKKWRSPSDNSDEDGDSARFRWADVGIAESVARTKGARGVILFYANSERYDVSRLQSFVERGRDLLAMPARLSKSRLTVEFGGYRKTLQAEFWFVPPNGKQPAPSPEEQCKEDGGN